MSPLPLLHMSDDYSAARLYKKINMINKQGFYELTASEYHADPCETPSLSSSIAVDLVVRSPAHAKLKHPRLSPGRTEHDDNPSLALGSIVHELALGKGGGYDVWPGDTWRGGEAAEFKRSASIAGKTAIKADDFARAHDIVTSMQSQLHAYGLGYALKDGLAEQVAVWREGDAWCRAMFDRWHPERNLVVDIKTTAKSAHPAQIAKTVAAFDYELRSEFYLRGASALTGVPAMQGGLGFLFVFVETAPPYLVTPCYLDADFKERGKKRAQLAIDSWSRCMDSGVWPGYVDSPVEIQAPKWISFENDDDEITTE